MFKTCKLYDKFVLLLIIFFLILPIILVIILKIKCKKNKIKLDKYEGDLASLQEERFHLEEILNQRFNFFIIVFGFIIAAIPYVKHEIHLLTILIPGTFIETALTLMIGRAFLRVKINLELLKKENDPSKTIKYIADRSNCLFKHSAFHWNIIVPLVITIFLIFCSTLSVIYWFIDVNVLKSFINY